MFQNYAISEMQQRNVVNDVVWMQDEDPSDVATRVQQVLQQYFNDSHLQ